MNDFIFKVVIPIIIVVIMLITWCFTNTDKERTEKILKINGYNNIHINGYAWFSCSKGDWSATKFSAILNNNQIEGAVCCGFIFKNCTIRFR